MHLITENICGTAIQFCSDDQYMDITSICAREKKLPNEFLRLPSTLAYMQALSKRTGISPENLVVKSRGGLAGFSRMSSDTSKAIIDRGTWAHPFLALECAGWVDPEFGVACTEFIWRWLRGEKIEARRMSPSEKRLGRQRLRVKGSELKLAMDDVRRQLEAMREADNIPGTVAVREWLAERQIVLTQGENTRLCIRLSKDARSGKIVCGEKSVAVNNAARVQRVPTYEPEDIAAAHAELFPALLPLG